MYKWKIVDSKVATTKQANIHYFVKGGVLPSLSCNNVSHCFNDAMIGQLCIYIQDLESFKKWACILKLKFL